MSTFPKIFVCCMLVCAIRKVSALITYSVEELGGKEMGLE